MNFSRHICAVLFTAIGLACGLWAVPSRASLVSLTLTNSWGQPDTNVVKAYALGQAYFSGGAWWSPGVLSDGTIITKGLPQNWAPDTNGMLSKFCMVGDYYLTNSALSRGLLLRCPDSSSNNTAYIFSGLNQQVTVVIGSTNLQWGTDSNGIVPTGQVNLYLFTATPPFTTNNYTHWITLTN